MPVPKGYFEIVVRDSSKFIPESFRTIDISVKKGIKALIGKLKSKPQGGTVIASYFFKKDMWKLEDAKEWVREHRKHIDSIIYKLMTEWRYTEEESQKWILEHEGGIEEMDQIIIDDATIRGTDGLIHKNIVAKVAEIDEDNKTVWALVTDETKDRVDEIILLSAWKKNLKYYKEHNILLSSHRYGSLQNQIGEGKRIKFTEEGMMVQFQYYADAGNKEADWAWFLAKKGKAMFSVGFMPITTLRGDAIPEEYRKSNPRAVFTEVELYEISQVLVGCNRNALQLGMDNPGEGEKAYMMDVVKSFGDQIPDLNFDEDNKGIKPFENEHACRLKNPKLYKTCRRTSRVSGGKKYGVITCQRKDDPSKWEEQAYRYDKTIWTEAQARKHCKDHNGILFEPAKKDANDDNLIGKTKRIFNCECLNCGHKMRSNEDIATLKCPECNSEMKKSEDIDIENSVIFPFDMKNVDELYEIISMVKSGRVISEKTAKLINSTISKLDEVKISLKALLKLNENNKPKDDGKGVQISSEVDRVLKQIRDTKSQIQ